MFVGASWTVALLFPSGCAESGGEPVVSEANVSSPSETAGTMSVDVSEVLIELEEPTPSNPVVYGAALVPDTAQSGNTVVFVVRVQVADGWHIYAADKDVSPSIPTTLKLDLPDGVEEAGNWVYPEAEEYDGALGDTTYIYHKVVSFHRQLRLSKVNSETIEVTCNLGYQVCNDQVCLRPANDKLRATLKVAAK